MKFLKRENIIDSKWNDCVLKSPNGLIYGLSWFLDGLVDKWSGLVWEENGEYTAVFPIPTRRKFGFRYVYPPFFIQQLGLFSQSKTNLIQEHMPIEFLQKNFKFVEVNLNYDSKIGKEKTNLILSLDSNYESIQKKYSQNHKRNIKKGEKLNLELRSESVSNVITLFKTDKGASLKTYSEKDYTNLNTLVNKAEESGHVIVKGVYQTGQLICGGVFMKFKNRIIFLFSGNSKKGKNTGALFFLLNSIITQYANSGFVFDFEGSQNEGLIRFYRGFGAKDENYTFYKHNNLPDVLKIFKR